MKSKYRKMLEWASCGAQIFSTCSKRQYMAIIIDPDGFVVGVGYNGAAKGMPHCIDGGCPRALENSDSGTNYDNCVSCHAEQNALLHSDYSQLRHGGTLIVNGSPCFTCAKLISNSGITKVVCLNDPAYKQWLEIKAYLLDCGLEVVEYDELAG